MPTVRENPDCAGAAGLAKCLALLRRIIMVRVVKTPIAPSTVSRLLASALRKLNLKSKVELASMGFRKNDPKGAQRNR